MADSTHGDRRAGRIARRRTRRASSHPRRPPKRRATSPRGSPTACASPSAWSWRLLLIGGVVAVIIFLIIQLRLIVIPILVAVLLGALLVPFSGFLQRHGWPKWLARHGGDALGARRRRRPAHARHHADRARLPTSSPRSRSWRGTSSARGCSRVPLHITEQQLNDFVEQIIASAQQDSGVLVSGALSVGSIARALPRRACCSRCSRRCSSSSTAAASGAGSSASSRAAPVPPSTAPARPAGRPCRTS